MLQLPQPRAGLNHVAFTVRDIHEVFGGGMHISRCGWDTEIGPGRHPVSSAYFWYFKNPAGALVEYYADEDQLTGEWQAREFEPGPTVFAEWAIAGGLDGNTRRQKNVEAPQGKFLTDKPKG
jgi:catechol-2,3-dioxygenase